MCPPTAKPMGKPTPEEGSTTTTTTSTITTTTTLTTTITNSATTFQEATTSLEILSHGTHLTCEINFKLTLDKGVQTKETTGTCAGSSSTSTADKIDTFGKHTFSLKTTEGIELECEIGAAMLDSGSLSEEVLESSLRCEATQDTCLTIEGPC